MRSLLSVRGFYTESNLKSGRSARRGCLVGTCVCKNIHSKVCIFIIHSKYMVGRRKGDLYRLERIFRGDISEGRGTGVEHSLTE